MLKNILKLEGAQELTKNDQKNISGSLLPGTFPCSCNGVYKKECATIQCCTDACK